MNRVRKPLSLLGFEVFKIKFHLEQNLNKHAKTLVFIEFHLEQEVEQWTSRF